jgi:acetyltransferase-like isoleucine patch superfamily enzyme
VKESGPGAPIIYANVQLGENPEFEPYTIIGKPPRKTAPGELATVLGANCIIRSHSVIYAGNTIGDGFQTGHQVMIRELNEIGREVSVGTGSVIEHHVKIGDRVRIHSRVFIPEYSVLEEGCWIGPAVVMTNAFHPLCPKVKDCLVGPTVKRGAKIGANATLLPGVVIGENALVGAGAVVTKDVPPGTVVAGNPAKVIKRIEDLECPFELIAKPYSPESEA